MMQKSSTIKQRQFSIMNQPVTRSTVPHTHTETSTCTQS